MRQLIEINSVLVQGMLQSPQNVAVLTLGIQGEREGDDSKVSILLTQWGANAIMDQLKGAGATGNSREEVAEPAQENAIDTD